MVGQQLSTEEQINKAKHLFEANELDSSLVIFRKITSYPQIDENFTYKVVSGLYMADIKRIKQEFDSAFYFSNSSKALLENSNLTNDGLWAEYFHRHGSILLNKGDYEDAIQYFYQSVEKRINNSSSYDTNLVLTYNNLGITHYHLGYFDKAMENYQKALNIIDRGEISRNKHVANCYQNTGILYATLGDYEQANNYFLKTQQIFEKLFSHDDLNLGRFYLNFGRMLQLAEQTDKALEYFDNAESIFVNNFDPYHSSLGVIMLNKANIYNRLGDYEKAFQYNSRAIAILQQNLNPSHPNVLSAFLNFGLYYEKKEDFKEAIEYYQKSLNTGRETPSNIKTYRNMANLYSLIGDNVQAEVFFNKAIRSSTEIFSTEHPETALSLSSYARFLTSTGKYDKAHEFLSRAKMIYHKISGAANRDYAHTIFRIGGNYFDRGDLQNALKSFQESIMVLANDFSTTDPLINPTVGQLIPDQYLLNALYMKAKTLHELFNQNKNLDHLESSLKTYDLSALLINQIRSNYLSDESKLIITGITNDILVGALDCALELYEIKTDPVYLEKAFEYSEKSKSAVLLASMNDLEAKQLARIPVELQDFERNLHLDLDSYNKLIYEERTRNKPDEAKIRLWQAKVFELNRSYDSLINQIFKQYPDYYNLRFSLGVTTIAEVRENLKKDQALIEFTLSDSFIYIFAVTSDSTIGLRKPLSTDFMQKLNSLRNQLTGNVKDDYSLSDLVEFIDLLHEVYNVLIQPVERVIQNKKLILVPDNQLGYLPFEILITDKTNPAKLDFKSLPYLIRRTSVSYAYSATLLHRKNNKVSAANGKILAFSPSYNGNELLPGESRQQDLLPIPWATDEVKSLTRTFRGKALIGTAATTSAFRNKAPDYLILHLAMHTLIDNENPMFSRLVFSQTSDTLEDQYLNTFELFNMELNAGLAVLSACKTGDGRLQRGEGIMSMARGFFYAGIPSIIMTLWDVDDYSSSRLIAHFYDYLAKGYEKDEALRMAKLDYLTSADKLKAHPHYWAGFVNIGDTGPVPLQKARPVWVMALIVVMLAVMAVYLSGLLKRSKK